MGEGERSPLLAAGGPGQWGAMITLDLESARKVLAAQPFSLLVGARLMVFEPGRAVLALDIRADLRQQNGFLHGGVLAYAADNAITFAAGTKLGPEVLTSGVTISYPAGFGCHAGG